MNELHHLVNRGERIKKIYSREILDSRGFPTVETEVYLENGCHARASVPSGASTGSFEAVELRDGSSRYFGKGVRHATMIVNEKIDNLLRGENVFDQRRIDRLMCEADGTENKSYYGANAILSVSIAVAKVAAKSCGQKFYRYLGGCNAYVMPVPMMNIINGGAHAKNNLDFQEFMIMPIGACCFREALRMGTEVYHALKKVLEEKGMVTAVGDEGGFAPNVADAKEALSLLMKAVEKAGYEPRKDIVFAMDAAASELYNGESKMYDFPGETKAKYDKMYLNVTVRHEVEDCGCEPVCECEPECDCVAETPDTKKLYVSRTSKEMIDYYEELIKEFPLVSIEDGLDEEDWEGWKKMTERLGGRVQLVGDDLFVTNVKRLDKGIEEHCGNSILIKMNQIGTLSETMEAIRIARENGFTTIVSHRSGETEDTTISDLVVSLNCGQIKTGAPCRSERIAKYNQLLRIEEEIGTLADYPGSGAIHGCR